MKFLTNLFLLISSLIASTGDAMSQNPARPLIAIQCQVNKAEIAPAFSEALCNNILDAAKARWENAEVFAFADAAEYDIRISVQVELQNANSAVYRLFWGNQQAWTDGIEASTDDIWMRMTDVPLNEFMAQRLVKGIFSSINVDL